MSSILLVEDDLSIITGLSFAIEKEGHGVFVARTVKEADFAFTENRYDMIILDVTLPDGNGFDFCREVRKTSKIPILFLTARDEETDIIMGLDIGGDDYITKPFKLAVLLSKINAMLRRVNEFSNGTELKSGDITINYEKGLVYKKNEPVNLTAGEYKLLAYFMQNPGIILSADRILSRLWDAECDFVDNNTLTVYIRRLREKIEDNPSEPEKIITVRRMGYKWGE